MAIHVVLPEIALEAAATVIVTSPTNTLDPDIETGPEAKPSEEPPSPDYVPLSPIHALASPDYHPRSDTEFELFEDESEPIEDAPEAAEPLPALVAPPPPVHSTPTLPTSSAEPTPAPPIISHDTRATAKMTVNPQPHLPLGYSAAIARWSAASLSTSYPSHTLKDSVSLFVSSSSAPSVPCFGPSCRRSRPISSSSSSGTSPIMSRPLPCKRHPMSSYSTPSASARPSRKRCRSPTTSLPAAASEPAILSSVPADRLPPHKRLRGSLVVSCQDFTIEAAAEPVSPPAHHGPTIEERLDEQSEVIRDMYEHLLEIPLPRIDEINEVSFYTLFQGHLTP
ncbi:hypothetical protein Tco_1039583 [Tanacetum coccineum]